MGFAFRDFIPHFVEKQTQGMIFSHTEKLYDSLAAAVEEANRWITTNEIRVINLETVLIPSVTNLYEQASSTARFRVNGEGISIYYQFVRVWYETKQ